MEMTKRQRKLEGKRAAAKARQQFKGRFETEPGYERSIHYIDLDGRTRAAYYSTEMGFEIACVRIAAEGCEILAAG